MVIDGHVHMWHKICKTEEFLGKLFKTGVDGSIVISQPPVSFEKGYEYLSFEKRIDKPGHLRYTNPIKRNTFPKVEGSR